MAEEPGTQTITSSSDQQKSVPVVTVESFYNSHAEKLQMKLEARRGFLDNWEPTSMAGLALSVYTISPRNVCRAGCCEHSIGKVPAIARVERFATYLNTRFVSCDSRGFSCASTEVTARPKSRCSELR